MNNNAGGGAKPGFVPRAQRPNGAAPRGGQPQGGFAQGGQRPDGRSGFNKPAAGGNRPDASAQASRPAAPGRPAQAGRPGGNGPAPRPGANQAFSGPRQQAGRRDRRPQGPKSDDLMPAADAMPVNKSLFNGFGGEQQLRRKGGANQRRANFAERVPTVRVVILGGLGEIGKNMMAVEYGNDIIIIDVGFAFPDERQPGVDYILPDVTYLERNKHKVRAIVVTHGHLDHIGGAGYMFPKFPVPVYGSKLSLAMVAKQIEEFKIHTPKFITLNPEKHERVQIGEFNLELVRVNHTIADATAVVLRTPAGTLINTGDWRLDPTPLDGAVTDIPRLTQIGNEGVLLLMSDSTSCDRPGRGGTEQDIVPTIEDLYTRAQGRIILSAFSSSITRMQMVIDITARSGRKLAMVGRSVLANIELCVRLGYIKVPSGLLIRIQDIGNYSDNNVVVLCTGSQGEENAALMRMSTGEHPNVKIKPGDTIILSSSVIPGNEVKVTRMIDDLMREGAQIFSRATEELKHHGKVHVGGHAQQEDTAEMIRAVRPKFYMPIHGEFHHLVYNGEVAQREGVATGNIFVMDNGDVLEMTANSAHKAERVPAGMVMVDGAGVGDVEGVVLRDRITMAEDGVFMVVATVNRRTGKLVSSPDIISRGFVLMKEHEDLINAVRVEVRRQFDRRPEGPAGDWAKFKLKLRDEVGDLLFSKTQRSPMILPVINEV
jgi:ribonuclease J